MELSAAVKNLMLKMSWHYLFKTFSSWNLKGRFHKIDMAEK